MGADMWWLILGGYVLGFLAAWIVAFRMLAADELMGVHTADNAGEAVGAIMMAGLLGLMIALFWPIVAVIFVLYRWAVAPALKNDSAGEEQR